MPTVSLAKHFSHENPIEVTEIQKLMERKLLHEASSYGYRKVDTWDELGLTPEQERQIGCVQKDPTSQNRRFLLVGNYNNQKVQILVEIWGNNYAMDIFSPSIPNTGHKHGNDFTTEQMVENLKFAVGQ